MWSYLNKTQQINQKQKTIRLESLPQINATTRTIEKNFRFMDTTNDVDENFLHL